MSSRSRTEKTLRRVETAQAKARRERKVPVRKQAGAGSKGKQSRETLFVEAYLGNGLNATNAAVSAGFSPLMGSEVLHRPSVKRRIEARLAEQQATMAFTADEVLRDLRDSFRFDRRELYGKDGKLLPVRKMSALAARHLEGVEVDYVQGRGVVAKARITKHIAVREQAMRHFALYPSEKQDSLDPDEAARLVRERLGDIDRLTAPRKP